MPREKEGYRENLERICERYPNKEMLNKKEVITFTGLNYKRVTKLFAFNNNLISKASLARQINTCKEDVSCKP